MTRLVQNITTETILATTAISALAIWGMYWYQRKKYSLPSKWQPIGKVKNLCIYPLKSGRRTELKTAICTEYGLQAPKSGTYYQLRDRNLIVYKEKTKEIHRHPKMLLIETAAENNNQITLNAPDMPALRVRIPSAKENQNTDEINFWKTEKILTLDCGDEAARWISNYILESESGLRIGFHDGLLRRNIMQAYKKYIPIYPNLRNKATGMYSNLSSYLLVNQASIDDLHSKIPESNITEHNFRPNILVESANPYGEDDWKWVKIGNAVFYFARPCTRCDFTTINPETAKKNENNEPLQTLRKYRLLRDLKKIELGGYRTVMGSNMGLHSGGEISIGDIVYVGES